MKWSAIEFANLCVAISVELRRRAHAGEIASTEQLSLCEWYVVVKDIVGRRDVRVPGPQLVAKRETAQSSVVVSRLRVVGSGR